MEDRLADEIDRLIASYRAGARRSDLAEQFGDQREHYCAVAPPAWHPPSLAQSAIIVTLSPVSMIPACCSAAWLSTCAAFNRRPKSACLGIIIQFPEES